MATALTPQTDVTSGKVTWLMENLSLQKIKSIKNPIYIFLNFIKSETSDSSVNHFDGHFAYLKTLDFYFNNSASGPVVVNHWCKRKKEAAITSHKDGPTWM